MRIETDKIRQIVRLLNLGYSQRSTAIQVQTNRSSVKTILDKLKIFPIDNSELNLFTNIELLDYFEISRIPTYPTRKIYPDFEYINQELKSTITITNELAHTNKLAHTMLPIYNSDSNGYLCRVI